MPARTQKLFIILFAMAVAGLFLPTAIFAAGEIPTASMFGGVFGEATLAQIIIRIVQLLLAALGFIALVFLVYAGFVWMTAAGDPGKVEKAQNIIKQVVIGLVVIFSAFAITAFIYDRFAPSGTGGTGGDGGDTGDTGTFDYWTNYAPVITYVDPALDASGDTNRNKITEAETDDDISNGAPGNSITIIGRYFGSVRGKVYFVKKSDNSRVEAEIAPCAGSWTGNQIIAVIPAGLDSLGADREAEVSSVSPLRNYNIIVEKKSSAAVALESNPWGFQVNQVKRPGICSMSPNHGAYPTETILAGYNFPTASPRSIIWTILPSHSTSTGNNWSSSSAADIVPQDLSGRSLVNVFNGESYSNSYLFMISSGKINSPCGFDTLSCREDISTCDAAEGLVCQFCSADSSQANYQAGCDTGKNCTCQQKIDESCIYSGDVAANAKRACSVGGCAGFDYCSAKGVWSNSCQLTDTSCVPFLGDSSGLASFSWAFSARKNPIAGMSCQSDIWNDGTCDVSGCVDSTLGCDTEATTEEWVELYNPTDAAIDLSSWAVTFQDNSYLGGAENTFAFLSGIIPARSYWLVANPNVKLPSVEGTIALRNYGSWIDNITYGVNGLSAAFSPSSFGRRVDGFDTDSIADFNYFANSSPNQANNPNSATTTDHLIINEISLAHGSCTCVPKSQLCAAGQTDTNACADAGQCKRIRTCQDSGHWGACVQADLSCIPYPLVPASTIASFSWAFGASGNASADGPMVISACDGSIDCSKNRLPSPSPWNRWTNDSLASIENEKACLNAEIYARFTQTMDSATLNTGNIRLYAYNPSAGIWEDQTVGYISSIEPQASGDNGIDSFIINLSRLLESNTSYRIFLNKKVRDESGRNLIDNPSGVNASLCGEDTSNGLPSDSGVCWSFQTRTAGADSICQIGCVNCSPDQYFNRYWGQEKGHAVHPISIDNSCIMLNSRDYAWDWSEEEQNDGGAAASGWSLQTILAEAYSWLTDPEAADGFGIASQPANTIATGYGTTTAYNESRWKNNADYSSWFGVDDYDFFQIKGQVQSTGHYGVCAAHNNFTDPIVIENQYCTKSENIAERILQSPSPWKGQTDACVNAVIFALFSRNMLNSTLIDVEEDLSGSLGDLSDNLEIYKCDAAEYATSSDFENRASGCHLQTGWTGKIFNYNHSDLSQAEVLQAPESANDSIKAEGIEIIPKSNKNLSDNTWYKVVIRGGLAGVRGGATAGGYEGPEGVLQVPSKNARLIDGAETSYYWYFRTGTSTCPINQVNVLPQLSVMKAIGLTQEYAADPVAANCNHLNPYGYAWNWQSLVNPFTDRCDNAAANNAEAIATICSATNQNCARTQSPMPEPFVKAFGHSEGNAKITARAEGTADSGASCVADKWGYGDLQIGLGSFRVLSYNNSNCLNSEISLQFSQDAQSLSLVEPNKNITVYKCAANDDACPLASARVVDNAKIKTPEGLASSPFSPMPAAANDVLIGADLEAGATYRVVVDAGEAGVQSYYGAGLEGLNFNTSGLSGSEACDPSVRPWQGAKDADNLAICSETCRFNANANLCGTDFAECNNNGNLAAFYDFNSDSVLNKTGLSPTGIAVNAEYATGKSGRGLRFVSSAQSSAALAAAADIPSLIDPEQGTISFWVRPLDVKGDASHIFYAGVGAGDGFGGEQELNISISPTRRFDVYYGANSASANRARITTADGAYEAGKWYYLTVAYSSNGELALYINGKKTLSTSTAFTVASNPYNSLYLGRSAGLNSARIFNGDLDDVAIYKRVLSASEVAALYGNGGEPKDIYYGCNGSCHKVGNTNASTSPRGIPVCGNGRTEEGEQCDDGAGNGAGKRCLANCLLAGSASSGTCNNGKLEGGQFDSFSWTFSLSDDAQVCQNINLDLNPCPNGVWSVRADSSVDNLYVQFYKGAASNTGGCISDADMNHLGFWRRIFNQLAKIIKSFFGFRSAIAADWWCPINTADSGLFTAENLAEMRLGNYKRNLTIDAADTEAIAYTDNGDDYKVNFIRDSDWSLNTEYKAVVIYERLGSAATSTASVTTYGGSCEMADVKFDVWPRGATRSSDSFFCYSDPSNSKLDECGRFTSDPYDDDMSAAWTMNQDGNGYNLSSNGAAQTSVAGDYRGGNNHLYRVWPLDNQGHVLRATDFSVGLANINTATVQTAVNNTDYAGDFWLTSGSKEGRSIFSVAISDSADVSAGSASGALPIYTYFCSNPWPDPQNFPFVDSSDNCKAGTGDCINTNFGTYYCRDAGLDKTCVRGDSDKLGQACASDSACWKNPSGVITDSCQLYIADDLPAIAGYDSVAQALSSGTGIVRGTAGDTCATLPSSFVTKTAYFNNLDKKAYLWGKDGTVYKGGYSQGWEKIDKGDWQKKGLPAGFSPVVGYSFKNSVYLWDSSGRYLSFDGKEWKTAAKGDLPVNFRPSVGYVFRDNTATDRWIELWDASGSYKVSDAAGIVWHDGAKPSAGFKAVAGYDRLIGSSNVQVIDSAGNCKIKYGSAAVWGNGQTLPSGFRPTIGFYDGQTTILQQGAKTYKWGAGWEAVASTDKLCDNKLKEFLFTNAATATTSDAIGLRIYNNNNHYSPALWYESKFNLLSSLSELSVDGYSAAQEGRTTYVNAADFTDNRNSVYTDMYLMSYNEGAGKAIENIYAQMVANWFFNAGGQNQGGLEYLGALGYCSQGGVSADNLCLTDLDCVKRNAGFCKSYAAAADYHADKAKITRDTQRLADTQDIYDAMSGYYDDLRCANDFNRACKTSSDCYGGGACGNFYPNLRAGSYITGKTFSVWPSWQDNLAKDLGVTLPVDPINKFWVWNGADSADCSNPYNSQTCWDQTNKQMACNLDWNSAVYAYYSSKKGVSARVYVKGEEYPNGSNWKPDWQYIANFGYNPFNNYEVLIKAGQFCAAIGESCGDGACSSVDGETCSSCPLDCGCGLNKSCQKNSSNAWVCGGLVSCGDGVIQPNEECDDRNLANGDGCSSNCLLESGYTVKNGAVNPVCGDGILKGSEQCEFKNGAPTCGTQTVSGALCCTDQCQFADWYVNAPVSKNPRCGDGLRTDQEECDCGGTAILGTHNPFACTRVNGPAPTAYSANPKDQPYCDTSCRRHDHGDYLYCGDGLWANPATVAGSTEQCDLGSENNGVAGKGCKADCTCNTAENFLCANGLVTKCGNSIVDSGEACDLGAANGTNGCTAGCACYTGYVCPNGRPTKCGNAIVDAGEDCDLASRNGAAGSGCDSSCLFTCTAAAYFEKNLTFGSATAASFSPPASGDSTTLNLPTEAANCRLAGQIEFSAKVNPNYGSTDLVFASDLSGSMKNKSDNCVTNNYGTFCCAIDSDNRWNDALGVDVINSYDDCYIRLADNGGQACSPANNSGCCYHNNNNGGAWKKLDESACDLADPDNLKNALVAAQIPKITLLREALTESIKELFQEVPDLKIGLIHYNEVATVDSNLTGSQTDLIGAVEDNYEDGDPNGGTYTNKALEKAQAMLAGSTAAHKVIVLMSDGKPGNNASDAAEYKTYTDTAATNAKAIASVYAAAFTSDSGLLSNMNAWSSNNASGSCNYGYCYGSSGNISNVYTNIINDILGINLAASVSVIIDGQTVVNSQNISGTQTIALAAPSNFCNSEKHAFKLNFSGNNPVSIESAAFNYCPKVAQAGEANSRVAGAYEKNPQSFWQKFLAVLRQLIPQNLIASLIK